MFKEQMNKFKSLIPKRKEGEDGQNKKKIENLIAFLIILIVTLIAINFILKDDTKETKEEETDVYKVLAGSETEVNRK